MHADVCWRMLTYDADVCWRMLTYADVCWRIDMTDDANLLILKSTKWEKLPWQVFSTTSLRPNALVPWGLIHEYSSIRPHALVAYKASNISTNPDTHLTSLVHHLLACVSIRQHMPAYVSISQHKSAYVSIRQHTSAYGSIQQTRTRQVFCAIFFLFSY
jgi:hypothetical protein